MSFRKPITIALIACALPALTVLTGCGGGPPAVSGVVYVDRAPPPAQIEVVGVAPSGRHLWIPGHFVWTGSGYTWRSGRWEVRPRERARWVPGRWRRHQGRWYWVDGRWR